MKKLTIKTLRERLLDLIGKMSVSEKIIFTILVAILIASALILFKRASNALSIEVPVSGGTLKEGVVGYPRYVNPLLPVTDSGRDLATLVFSGLMKIGPNGKLILDLAKDYKISDDGLVYTLTLKDGIYFHDNVPVTAYDVEFTVKKVTDPIIKSPKAANWQGVAVKATNEKTIEFTLKKPYSPFIQNLTLGILPEHIWKDVGSDAFLFSEFNFEPVGSGPYKIQEIKRNASGLPDYYYLVPFERYALGPAFINNLYVYFFTSEDKLMEAYQNGAIDSMSSIAPENAKKIDSGRSDILTSPLPRIYAVFFNQSEAQVFVDKSVRQALALATPKEEIIKNILGGFGTPIESPLPADISKITAEKITSDEGLKKAKALLEKAGWTTDAKGQLSKKDKKSSLALSFSLATSDVPELIATAELLKTAWQKLGAKVEVKIFNTPDLEQNIIVPRKFDALLFGESVGRNADLFAFWHSSERLSPGLNIALYTNSKGDKYLFDARTTNDEEKRISLYQNFEKEVINDIPAVFLYSPDLIYAVPKNLRGTSIEGIIGSSERFSNIEKWYLETENIWQIPYLTK